MLLKMRIFAAAFAEYISDIICYLLDRYYICRYNPLTTFYF